MVAIWGLPPLSDSIEEDKALRLSTGVTVDLSEFNLRLGNKPSDKKLVDMTAKVQAAMDHVQTKADMVADEPTKNMTDAQLLAQYGDKVFNDGSGNLVTRNTKFSLTWAFGRLIPRWEVVS